jgi:nicotinate-nucleotide adenylyltransferase
MRIGVLGGRFDPPHFGHLMVAQSAWQQLVLDALIFVPVGIPADRPAPQYDGDLRVAMVSAAISGRSGWSCSRTEIDRGRPSYTAETLEEIANDHPDADLWFVMGADRLQGFSGWHRPERILSCARLAVISRDGISPTALEQIANSVAPGRVDILHTEDLDASSTMVRARLAAGDTVNDLVPERVARLLSEHKDSPSTR